MKRIARFRILLPAVSIVLAAALFWLGSAQYERARSRSGSTGGSIPDVYARAKYASYAMNAPAWVGQECVPRNLHIWRADQTDSNAWYFLFVGLMWYVIGIGLDRTIGLSNRSSLFVSRWWSRAVGAIVVGCGWFVSTFAPYGAKLPPTHEWWFYGGIRLWGAGMILGGLYYLLSHRQPIVQ